MVEGERTGLGKRNPRSRRGVVVTYGIPSSAVDQEGHGRRGLAGVAVRPRIHADDPYWMTDEPGLLAELANESCLDRLPELDEPSRERPEASERWPSPTHEEHPTGPEPNRVHRQRRVLVPRAHFQRETDRLLGVARS